MSEFKFACPVCRQHIQSDSSASGTQIECPTCFQKIVVPQAPKDEASKFILSATTVAPKNPLVEGVAAREALEQPPPRQRSVWRVVGVMAGVLALAAAAALVLGKAGWWKPARSVTSQDQTNAVGKTATPTRPDPRWKLDLTDAVIPTNTASGRIHGREFTCQRATIQGGTLSLRQGPTWPPDLGVTVVLRAPRAEDLSGKRFLIPTNFAGNPPRVVLRWKDEQQQARAKYLSSGYALVVEFGRPAGGRMPGQIYLCTPDAEQSVVLGSFSAEIRKPPPPKSSKPASPPRS